MTMRKIARHQAKHQAMAAVNVRTISYAFGTEAETIVSAVCETCGAMLLGSVKGRFGPDDVERYLRMIPTNRKRGRA